MAEGRNNEGQESIRAFTNQVKFLVLSFPNYMFIYFFLWLLMLNALLLIFNLKFVSSFAEYTFYKIQWGGNPDTDGQTTTSRTQQSQFGTTHDDIFTDLWMRLRYYPEHSRA